VSGEQFRKFLELFTTPIILSGKKNSSHLIHKNWLKNTSIRKDGCSTKIPARETQAGAFFILLTLTKAEFDIVFTQTLPYLFTYVNDFQIKI
jgi:hypothetical protein